MSENARPLLADYLARHYSALKLRLTRLLGNGDLAGDALQDTWLRLQSREEDGPINSPASYLVRVAVNIALDVQRRQSRQLPFDEIESLMELSDDACGPAQIVESRSEVEAAFRIMERLPERRRLILILVRWEGLQQKEVASRLGISVRVVENELKRAHDFLDEHLRRDKKS